MAEKKPEKKPETKPEKAPALHLFAEVLARVHAVCADLAEAGNWPSGVDFSRIVVEPPRDPSHGDMATNAAMLLAKEAKAKPRDLAEAIASRLRADALIASVDVAGPGFINLTLKTEAWAEALRTVLRDGAAYGRIAPVANAAKVNVDYTRIVSPIVGRVGLRNIDPGNVVTANGTTGLCVITQLQPITVIFVIAEDSIDEVFAQMSTGKPMQVIALDRSKQHTLATGTLLTVDNQVNTTTGTVRARATFPNTHNELFPSQFVNARLLVKTLTQVNLVPQAAIQHNNDVAFVYVVQPDSSVQSRNVKILATEGETSAVIGVNPGDQLVNDGFDKLQNGSKVVIRKQAPAEANAAPPKTG